MPIYAEPTWDGSISAYPTSFFENRVITPFQMTGAIVSLLQYQFSAADNIDNDLLKGYIWTDSDATSKITIGPSFMRNDNTTSAKPGIYVERQDLEAKTLGVRYLHISAEDAVATSIVTGDYNKHVSGKHVVICEGISGSEAEMLGEEIFMRFMAFSPAMKVDFNVDTLDISGMGKVQDRPKQPNKTFFTPVVLSWQKTYQWSLQTETPIS